MDQIKNLLVAQAMIAELPDASLMPGLRDWANDELRYSCDAGKSPEPKRNGMDCGAVGCFGGWVAVTPYFKKLGVECDSDGSPTMKPGPNDYQYSYGGRLYADGVSNKIFGQPGLFDSQRGTEYGKTPRQAINERIRNALVKLTTEQEDAE